MGLRSHLGYIALILFIFFGETRQFVETLNRVSTAPFGELTLYGRLGHGADVA